MKIFFLILVLLISFTQIPAQTSYGARVAYNNTHVTNASEYAITKSINRSQAGIFGKCYVHKQWYLKGNLIYNQKGNFYDDTRYIADDGRKVIIKLNYAEVSIDAGYSFRINDQQHIHLGVGPYLAYGISGTEKGYRGSIWGGPVEINRRVDFVSGQPNAGPELKLKQFDAGLNSNVEYQYKNYGLFINYGLGLASRAFYSTVFNRVASIGLTYSFTLTRTREKGCYTELDK